VVREWWCNLAVLTVFIGLTGERRSTVERRKEDGGGSRRRQAEMAEAAEQSRGEGGREGEW
jgi:hypothetical protein